MWGRAAAAAALLVAAGASGAVADVDDPPELGGEPIGPSTDRADPETLTVGEWATVLGSPASGEDRHWFRYTRQVKESTVHVSVVAVGTSGEDFSSEYVDLAASVGETTCGSAHDSAWSTAGWATFGTRLSVGPGDHDPDTGRQDRSSACLNDEIRLEVGRGTSASGDLPDLPVRIKIVEERPLTQPAELAEAADDDRTWRQPSVSGEPRDLDGAAAPGDAPVLRSGGATSTTVTEGEERFFTLPLAWGEGALLRVTSPALEELEEGRYSRPSVRLAVLDPLGNDLGSDFSGSDDSESLSSSEPIELSAGIAEIRHLNRESDMAGMLPGDHVVSLTVTAPPDDAEAIEVPLTVEVERLGTSEPTPPYVDEPAFLVADDTWAETPSGALPTSGAEDGEGLGARRWAALGLGAVGVVSCLGGLVLLRRRRA